MQGWVDLVGLVTYRGGILARRRSPIPVLTGLSVEQLCSWDERRYRHAKPPTWNGWNGCCCCRFSIMSSRIDDDGVLRHDQLLHASCQPQHGNCHDGQRNISEGDRETRGRKLHHLTRRYLLPTRPKQDQRYYSCMYQYLPFLHYILFIKLFHHVIYSLPATASRWCITLSYIKMLKC